MKKRSVTIAGHRTSVTLEDLFWEALKKMALQKGCSLRALIESIDARREAHSNLSSALRLHILKESTLNLSDL